MSTIGRPTNMSPPLSGEALHRGIARAQLCRIVCMPSPLLSGRPFIEATSRRRPGRSARRVAAPERAALHRGVRSIESRPIAAASPPLDTVLHRGWTEEGAAVTTSARRRLHGTALHRGEQHWVHHVGVFASPSHPGRPFIEARRSRQHQWRSCWSPFRPGRTFVGNSATSSSGPTLYKSPSHRWRLFIEAPASPTA